MKKKENKDDDYSLEGDYLANRKKGQLINGILQTIN